MNQIVRTVALQAAPSASEFKGAMRNLAGGVSIVTVRQGSNINGMTVTSLSSFSAEPPTVLVCINQSASSYPALVQTGTFGVSILSADQTSIAERFSGHNGVNGRDRFAGSRWKDGVTGVPLLVGAAVAFDCTVDEIIERHSHAIVLGRVCNIHSEPEDGAIVYRDGSYTALPLVSHRTSKYGELWY